MRAGWRELALLALSVAAALGCLEAAARLLPPPDDTPIETRLTDIVKRPYRDVPYLFQPNHSFRRRWPGNPNGYFDADSGIEYRTNNYGFRGPDMHPERLRRLRVAFLGDSFCWGHGVRDEDVFVARLQRALDASPEWAGHVELLNFGMSGFGTGDELALLKELVAPSFEPDIVVIWYFLNDPQTGGLGTIRTEPAAPRSSEFWRGSRAVDWLLRVFERRARTRAMIASYGATYAPGSAALGRLQEQLAQIHEACRQSGATPLLVVHPILFRLAAAYPFTLAHTAVLAACRRADIATLDLLPAFLGHKDSELWVHPSDQHPNAAAHRIAAEALLPVLEASLRQVLEAPAQRGPAS